MPRNTDGLKKWREHYSQLRDRFPNLTGKQRMQMAKETYQRKPKAPRKPCVPPKKRNPKTNRCRNPPGHNTPLRRKMDASLKSMMKQMEQSDISDKEMQKQFKRLMPKLKPKPKPKPRVRTSNKEKVRRQKVFERLHGELNPLPPCRKGYTRSKVTRRCQKDCVPPKPVRNAKGRCVKK